jgi:hypothetical protein
VSDVEFYYINLFFLFSGNNINIITNFINNIKITIFLATKSAMPTGHQKIMKQEFPAIYLSFSLHGQPSLEGKYNPLRMCIETE